MYEPPFILFNYDPISDEFISVKNVALQTLPFLSLLVLLIILWSIFGVYMKQLRECCRRPHSMDNHYYQDESNHMVSPKLIMSIILLITTVFISISFLVFTITSPIYILHISESITSMIDETNHFINRHKNGLVDVSRNLCDFKTFTQKELELIQSVYNATSSNGDRHWFVNITEEIEGKFTPLSVSDELQTSESYLSVLSILGCQLYNVISSVDDIDIKVVLRDGGIDVNSYLTTIYMGIRVYTTVLTIICFFCFISYCLFCYPFYEHMKRSLCLDQFEDEQTYKYFYKIGFTLVFFFLGMAIIIPIIVAGNIACKRIDSTFINTIKPNLESFCSGGIGVSINVADVLGIDVPGSIRYTLLEEYLSLTNVSNSNSGKICQNIYNDFKVYIPNQFHIVDNSINNSLKADCSSLSKLIIDTEEYVCTHLPLYLVIVFSFTLLGVSFMLCTISYLLLSQKDDDRSHIQLESIPFNEEIFSQSTVEMNII